jgi:hypothetical protein
MTAKNQETAAVADKLTPAQWAERKGIAPKSDAARPWIEPVAKSTKECSNGIHLHAADALHGWSNHAYNFQAESDALLLTEAEFDAALVAAAGYPACNAHLPAVAPKAPFRAEIEARAKKEAEAKAKAEADAKAPAIAKKDPA